MSKADLSEISIEEKQTKLILKRECKCVFSKEITNSPPGQIQPQVLQNGYPSPLETISSAPEKSRSTESTVEKNLHYVTTPLVGTFYTSPAPDAPVYVQKGDKISKGQTICIVEAMKLMNEIESDVNGVVEEILCENASPVEFGSKLFAIRVG